MSPLLTISDLHLYYDHVHALKGVSVQVNEGETVALIGANGAGKSSILRAITCGLARPRLARCTDGQRIDGRGPDEIVAMGISMVPEGRRVFPYMSVRDNLLMGAFSRSDRGEIEPRSNAC
ncbi:MAG: ATP-binding cassette domain-containing protein [Burkholderiaceae bacterium]